MVKETYWSQSQNMTSMSVSYNNSWHGVSYSLSYSMNKNTRDSDEDGNEVTNDNQFSLSVSVPLDCWMHNTGHLQPEQHQRRHDAEHRPERHGAEEDNLNWNIREGAEQHRQR